MEQLQVLLSNLFPVSIQILTADDIQDISIWTGNLSASEAANLLDVEHFMGVVKGKSPDQLYEATIGVDASVTPTEGGYRIRCQCYDVPSLNAFLEAITNA